MMLACSATVLLVTPLAAGARCILVYVYFVVARNIRHGVQLTVHATAVRAPMVMSLWTPVVKPISVVVLTGRVSIRELLTRMNIIYLSNS